MKRLLLVMCACLLALGVTNAASAAPPTDKGLLISPLRSYVSVDAGKRQAGTLTVANLTAQPLNITLSVKQFSVANYTYNYDFKDSNNWIQFSTSQISLQPNGSQSITYFITIPKGTPAGGQYYTLLASATLGSGSLVSTVRAASLVYVTINGNLVRTSQLVGSSIPRFWFGKQLSYTLDVRNTGNVHYFAYYSGQLHGLTARSVTGTSHILLPGAIRRVTGDIDSPLLPGIYRATFGYKTDAGTTVQQARFVIFVPPWSLALVAVCVLVSINLYSRRKHAANKADNAENEQT